MLNIFNNFRHHFLEACYSGKISDHTILQFQNGIAQQNLSWDEALLFIQNDSFSLIERYLTSAETDGGISEPDANYIFKLQQLLRLPQINQSAFLERIQRLRFITNLRTGRLPSTVPSVHLDAGEICHLEIAATYTKVNLRSVKTIPGRFVITNKKLNFLSESGGWKILWNNIMRIERDSQSIYLELSTKTGNGRYFLKDPLLTEATIDTLTRMAKRQFIAASATPTRHIPQDVKLAVWHRDSGKCVQCQSSSYLEYDHIIPFSEGGANTIGNIQLLCRNCNLAKGNRI